MLLTLLENAFASQKLESRNFYSCTHRQNSSSGYFHQTPGKHKSPSYFPQAAFFQKPVPSRKGQDLQVIHWQCSLSSLNKEFHLLLLFHTKLNRQSFHSLFRLHLLSILFLEFLSIRFAVAVLLFFSKVLWGSFSPAQIFFWLYRLQLSTSVLIVPSMMLSLSFMSCFFFLFFLLCCSPSRTTLAIEKQPPHYICYLCPSKSFNRP